MNDRTPSSRSSHSSRRSRDSSRSSAKETLSRDQRKEATRRAIVAAALHLLDERSFG
ncbi:MAG: TetR family transcriptional regulator, partial [Mycobacterium sp.]